MNEILKNNQNIFLNIVRKIEDSIDLLCECEREKHLQDILAAQLKCEKRQTYSSSNYPDIEVDLMGDKFAIEVKYNDKYYSGFGQILAQKSLFNFYNVFLIHLNEYIDNKFINAFSKLVKLLEIKGILIDKRNKKYIVVN